MKHIPNLAVRLRKAAYDPFFCLAEELVYEGYTEADVDAAMKKVKGIPDPDIVKVLNYVRTIERKQCIK